MAGKQGFASMDESKQKEIASKGGKASGTAHSTKGASAGTGTSNRGGLTQSARSKGGHNSH